MLNTIPCPFCGEVEYLRIDDASELEECTTGIAVICDATKGGCGATCGYQPTEEKAITAWEQRKKNETYLHA